MMMELIFSSKSLLQESLLCTTENLFIVLAKRIALGMQWFG